MYKIGMNNLTVDARNGKILTQTFLNLLRLSEIDEIITLGL
jgi:hypothetical protein